MLKLEPSRDKKDGSQAFDCLNFFWSSSVFCLSGVSVVDAPLRIENLSADYPVDSPRASSGDAF